jgi:hypothetical protein
MSLRMCYVELHAHSLAAVAWRRSHTLHLRDADTDSEELRFGFHSLYYSTAMQRGPSTCLATSAYASISALATVKRNVWLHDLYNAELDSYPFR